MKHHHLIKSLTLKKLLLDKKIVAQKQSLFKWLAKVGLILGIGVLFFPFLPLAIFVACGFFLDEKIKSETGKIINTFLIAISSIVSIVWIPLVVLVGLPVLGVWAFPIITSLPLAFGAGMLFFFAASLPFFALRYSFNLISKLYAKKEVSLDDVISEKIQQIVKMRTKVEEFETQNNNISPKVFLRAYANLYAEYKAGENYFNKNSLAEIKHKHTAYKKLVTAIESITRIQNLDQQIKKLSAEQQGVYKEKNPIAIIDGLIKNINDFFQERKYKSLTIQLIEAKNDCQQAMIELNKSDYTSPFFDKMVGKTKQEFSEFSQIRVNSLNIEDSALVIFENSYQFNLLDQLSSSVKNSGFIKTELTKSHINIHPDNEIVYDTSRQVNLQQNRMNR